MSGVTPAHLGNLVKERGWTIKKSQQGRRMLFDVYDDEERLIRFDTQVLRDDLAEQDVIDLLDGIGWQNGCLCPVDTPDWEKDWDGIYEQFLLPVRST